MNKYLEEGLIKSEYIFYKLIISWFYKINDQLWNSCQFPTLV